MGILRKAISPQAINRFYFQNQISRQGTDAFVSPFASLIGNVKGISVASEANVQVNSLVQAAKSKLTGKVLPSTVRDYATSVESNKFTYYKRIGGNPMIQQVLRHDASNVRFYSSSSGVAATSKTQPKEKSYPTVFWHLHEGIEEIVADYVHHEMTQMEEPEMMVPSGGEGEEPIFWWKEGKMMCKVGADFERLKTKMKEVNG